MPKIKQPEPPRGVTFPLAAYQKLEPRQARALVTYIVRLYKAGWRLIDIQHHTGRSYAQVQRIVKDAGVTRPRGHRGTTAPGQGD